MSLHIHITRLATPDTTLVSNLGITIAPGTVHTLMGDSGSGKSSVLAAICGALDGALAFEGEVLLDGARIDTLPTEPWDVPLDAVCTESDTFPLPPQAP